MIKLQEIIPKLEINTYRSIETKLLKTKAENFLFLLRALRDKNYSEEEIIKELGLTTNSFYTLKSRLYDRIQEELTQDITPGKKEIYRQVEEIHEICYSQPFDVAVCFLLKLEKDLKAYDMYVELLLVYGALKKLHYNTANYFNYSQLHNKHIAFWLSIEKAEDLLSNFNQILEQYDLSRAPEWIDQLLFIREEINTHLELNPSKNIELIKNIIDLQFDFFCETETDISAKTDYNFESAFEKINKLPESSPQKKWETALNFLAFGFYDGLNQKSKAHKYYERIKGDLSSMVHYSNVALVSKFYIPAISYLNNSIESHAEEYIEKISFNRENMYSTINIYMCKALCFFQKGQIKKAIAHLNELLANYSFKEYFHAQMEIKFSLAFFYWHANEIELAESLVDSIYKKIKTNNIENYSNTLHLIRFFRLILKANSSYQNKQKEELLLFLALNKGREEMLVFLTPMLKNLIKS